MGWAEGSGRVGGVEGAVGAGRAQGAALVGGGGAGAGRGSWGGVGVQLAGAARLAGLAEDEQEG